MLLEATIIGGKYIHDMMKSDKLEQQAVDKTIRSLDKLSKAQAERNAAKECMNQEVIRFGNRKRGILFSSMQQFVDLYKRIIKINFSKKEEAAIFKNFSVIEQSVMELNVKMVQKDIKTPGPTKNVVAGCLVGGVGGLSGGILNLSLGASNIAAMGAGAFVGAVSSSIVDDSKRKLEMANIEAKRARMLAIQNNSIELAYDAITQRVTRMTDVLTKLNVMFVKSIHNTEKIIDKNGVDKRNYSKVDREQLATCIDLVVTIKKFIDAPIVDEEGKVTKKSEEVLMLGNTCINQVNETLNQI